MDRSTCERCGKEVDSSEISYLCEGLLVCEECFEETKYDDLCLIDYLVNQ